MDDVDKLEGASLATAVAIEVMGWCTFAGGSRWWYIGKIPILPIDEWNPDRDWNQAMEVIEWVCGKLSFSMGIHLDSDGILLYWIIETAQGETCDESGPTAICRACLKAVRAAKESIT